MTVCAGGSVTVGTSTYTSTGTYSDVLTSYTGCDSTVTTNLTVRPAITGTQTLAVCAGGSITVGTSTYTSPGTYTDVLTSYSGCDSTVTTHFTVNPLPTITANASSYSICSGSNVTLTGGGAASYSWTGGETDGVAFVPASSGSYTVTGTDGNGCSNTASTYVTVNAIPVVTANSSAAAICPGGSVTLTGGGAANYVWTGGVTDGLAFAPVSTATYTVTGSITYTVSGTVVCSNTAATSVTVNAPITGSQTMTVCAGGSVTVGTSTYTTTGTYSDILTSYSGCDSTVTTNLTVRPAITGSQTTTVCAGGSITVGSNTYTTTGTYTDLLLATNGCDSTVTTNLTVNAQIVIGNIVSQSVCYTDTITFTGTASGGTGRLHYLWNTGDTTTTIKVIPLATSTYTLTVTDSLACSNNTTALATIIPSTDIFGHVSFSAGSVTAGNAVLYAYYPHYTHFDTAQVQPLDASGNYHFTAINHHQYILKIFADTTVYHTLIPTYYGNPVSQFLWDSSTVINHGCNLNDSLNITMAEQSTTTGTSIIHGRIIKGLGFAKNLGDPIPGIDVKIGRNPGGQMVISTTTSDTTSNDGGGYFYFTSLPYGSYYVYADIPGLHRDSVITVSLSSSNPDALQVNYVADSNSVFVPLSSSCNVNSTVINHNDTLTAFRYGTDVIYQWIDCSSSALVPGATSQNFTTTTPGLYQVQITDFGCVGLSNCYTLGNVGLSQIDNSPDITIAPNPFTSQTTIFFTDEQKNCTIQIVDLLGNEIKKVNFTGNQYIIEKGEMNAGIYFLIITDENKNSINRKIILE